MKINLKNVKTCVFGIQGSGKTYLVNHKLINSFKHPLLYRVHSDYDKIKGIILYKPKSFDIKDLDDFCLKVKQLAIKKKIDCFILEEADMFIRSTLGIPNHLRDLILNHRHYNLALIFVSRRPQSIPTEVVESCENIFVFKIEGENVDKKFRAIHPHFKELLPKLDKNKHNFLLKTLGDSPKLYSAVS